MGNPSHVGAVYSMHMNSPLNHVRRFALTFLSLVLLPVIASAAASQAWLLVSGDWRDTLMTTDYKERDMLTGLGWKISGTGMLQSSGKPGAIPLHRMFKAGANPADRLLETSPSKVAAQVKAGFVDEGVLGYVASEAEPGLVPVYHYRKQNKHFWLIDPKEKAAAERNGWKADGISFWLWPVTPAESAAASESKEAKSL